MAIQRGKLGSIPKHSGSFLRQLPQNLEDIRNQYGAKGAQDGAGDEAADVEGRASLNQLIEYGGLFRSEYTMRMDTIEALKDKKQAEDEPFNFNDSFDNTAGSSQTGKKKKGVAQKNKKK